MEKDLKDAVVSVLLNMHNDAQGKLILKKLQIERFVIPPKDLFEHLRRAVGKLEGWK